MESRPTEKVRTGGSGRRGQETALRVSVKIKRAVLLLSHLLAKTSPVRGTLLLLSCRNSTCLLPGRQKRSARLLKGVIRVPNRSSPFEGGTGPIPRFKAPVAIARLYYRVQGTCGRRDLTFGECE